jgi:hypothetical protein
MAAHVPGVFWSLRSMLLGAGVHTVNDRMVKLILPADPSWMRLVSVEMDRKDARLLAKRINQCLDDTASRGKYGRRAGAS